MKRTLLIYSIALCLFTACESDPKWSPKTLTYSDSFTPSWRSAGVALFVDEQSDALTQNIEIGYSEHEDFSDATYLPMTHMDHNQWSVSLSDLKDSTNYYIIYRFMPSYLQSQVETSSFRTLPLPPPVVETKSVLNITATTADIYGNVQVGESNDSITERGFYYSLLREGEFVRKQISCGKGVGDFFASINALRANATYYYVAYAINKHGIAYGDTLQFNTLNPYNE